MAWLPSHESLRNHPKLRRAAGLAGVPEVQMIGHLHCLWWWALSYADDGDLSEYDDFEIADAADWDDNDGDPSVFVKALLNCGRRGSGFLDPDRHLHDWNQYAGKYAEKRSAVQDGARGNHIRWHEKRGVVVDDCPFCQPDSPPTPPDDRGDDRPESESESQIREEEKRQEEREGAGRRSQQHDLLLPPTAALSLLEELDGIIDLLLDRYPASKVDEAVQHLVDTRRRFPWPSDVRAALTAALGAPVSAVKESRVSFDETHDQQLARLRAQRDYVDDERDREAIDEQIAELLAKEAS